MEILSSGPNTITLGADKRAFWGRSDLVDFKNAAELLHLKYGNS